MTWLTANRNRPGDQLGYLLDGDLDLAGHQLTVAAGDIVKVGNGGVIRATLTGERAHSLVLDPQTLSKECGDGFAYLEFRDHSRVSHDLEAAAQEFTSRGEMVRKLVDHKQGSRQEEQAVGRALQLALDAFDE